MTTNDKELAQVLLAINTTLTQQQTLQTQAQKNGCISNTLKILAVMFVFMCAIVSLVTLALVSSAESTAGIVKDLPSLVESTNTVQPITHEEVVFNMYKAKPNGTGGIHGVDVNYMGIDRNLGCGTPLYAPLDGTVTWAGLDGYNHVTVDEFGNSTTWPQATLVSISGDAGDFSVLHLIIDENITYGQQISKGTLIGTESDIGYSFGCHTHSVWEPNPNYVPLALTTNTGDSYYGELRDCSLGTCKLSGFTPQNKDGTFNEGSLNCDGDCTMTASGNATVDLLTSGKCYVAAPSDVPFDTVISIDGVGDCTVADRGGYINHLYEGESDVACISALSKGNVQACGGATTAITEYYWLDIISYGD